MHSFWSVCWVSYGCVLVFEALHCTDSVAAVLQFFPDLHCTAQPTAALRVTEAVPMLVLCWQQQKEGCGESCRLEMTQHLLRPSLMMWEFLLHWGWGREGLWKTPW